MKNLITIAIISLLFFVACKKQRVFTEVPENDYIAFGHFYGECVGESCVENYRVTASGIWEDQKDAYPDFTKFYNGNYIFKSNNNLAAINSLVNNIPAALLADSNTVIGSPDAGDQGGIYFEINKNGIHKFWLMDRHTIAYDSFRNDIITAIQLAQ